MGYFGQSYTLFYNFLAQIIDENMFKEMLETEF